MVKLAISKLPKKGSPLWIDPVFSEILMQNFFGAVVVNPETGAQKMWNGTVWVNGVLKVHTASGWNTNLKRWNGTAWIST